MEKVKTIAKATFRIKMKKAGKYVWNHKIRYLCILPAVVWFTIFCYVPMFGIVLGIKEYTFAGGIWGSPVAEPWYKWFQLFLSNSTFWDILRNTVVISFLKMLTGFPAPIILALLLNEVRCSWFKKSIQTLSYLPYFISWVIVAAMLNQLLTPYGGQGPLNKVFQFLSSCFDIKHLEGNRLGGDRLSRGNQRNQFRTVRGCASGRRRTLSHDVEYYAAEYQNYNGTAVYSVARRVDERGI